MYGCIGRYFLPKCICIVNAARSPFWQTQPGLVWSNPQANDAVHIRRALLHPRFEQLLEIALEFGLGRLREEWAVLQADGVPEASRVRYSVERILLHLAEGFARAAQRD